MGWCQNAGEGDARPDDSYTVGNPLEVALPGSNHTEPNHIVLFELSAVLALDQLRSPVYIHFIL